MKASSITPAGAVRATAKRAWRRSRSHCRRRATQEPAVTSARHGQVELGLRRFQRGHRLVEGLPARHVLLEIVHVGLAAAPVRRDSATAPCSARRAHGARRRSLGRPWGERRSWPRGSASSRTLPPTRSGRDGPRWPHAQGPRELSCCHPRDIDLVREGNGPCPCRDSRTCAPRSFC